MGVNKVLMCGPSPNMRVILCTYVFCILCVYLPLASGASVIPLVDRLHTEADAVRAAFEEQTGLPSFGLEQLQLASNLLSNLWKNVEENVMPTEMPPIKFPVPAVETAPQFTKMPRNPTTMPRNPAKTPRGVSDSNFGVNDCNTGKARFSNETEDTCAAGLFCRVIEALCTINGSPVYVAAPINGSVDGFNWSVCEVTKMSCIIDFDTGLEQTYDLREQYGASNCTPIPEATVCFALYGAVPICYVQLQCNNFLLFGYNSYGLKCENDQLMCGSTAITDLKSSVFGRYQSDVINGKCQLNKNGCVIPYSNNPTCTLFNYTCGFQTDLGINYNNSCLLQRYDVPCTQQTAQSSNCVISQITCNGVVRDTSQPVPDQDHCVVSQISCDGNTVAVNPTSCVPTMMLCNGMEAYFSTYTGALSQCVIEQLTCPPTANCTTLQFACPQAPKCQVSQLPCTVQCEQQMNVSSCVCPDDRVGPKCQSRAPVTCSASLIYPPLNCLPSPLPDPNDKLLDGDRKCTVYDNYNADASLGFLLDCQYNNYTPDPESRLYNFTYWATNGEISFSQPVYWNLRQKIFNFKQLWDRNATIVTPDLTAAQLLGEEPVWFNFSLANVPDRFWYARRLYYEVDFNYTGVIGATPENTASRGFIDAPTRPISSDSYLNKINPITVVLVVGGVLVFLGISGYIGYKYYRFYRKQHPVSGRN